MLSLSLCIMVLYENQTELLSKYLITRTDRKHQRCHRNNTVCLAGALVIVNVDLQKTVTV